MSGYLVEGRPPLFSRAQPSPKISFFGVEMRCRSNPQIIQYFKRSRQVCMVFIH
jgi:hypothetical protein